MTQFFDRSVTKIKDNKGNIATRAANGYFYLPGRSGEKAFYLAPGETAQVIERANNQVQKYQEVRDTGRRNVIRETQ